MKARYLVILALGCSLAAFSKGKPTTNGDLQLVCYTQASSFGAYSSVTRSMSASFQSPTRAPAGALGNVTVPSGLGVGPLVPLNITNVEGKDISGGGKVIHYWGCSPVILKGQPEVLNGQHTGTGKTVLGGSAGYTDSTKMMGLTEASKVAGDYPFKISYLGDVHIPLTEKQQFLAPINITEPASGATADPASSNNITWTPVPGALGYSVTAAGKNSKGETVFWENSKDCTSSWYLEGVVAAVKAGKLHGPEHKTCTIPAGIFSGMTVVTVTGYSQEAYGTGALKAVGWAQTGSMVQLGHP